MLYICDPNKGTSNREIQFPILALEFGIQDKRLQNGQLSLNQVRSGRRLVVPRNPGAVTSTLIQPITIGLSR